ncbi:MAG: hypothetical protein JRF63_12360 [Deltaproteobacteria bacterium]|nr:hypothetical protein [Deltaproteobacteria bacterium]
MVLVSACFGGNDKGPKPQDRAPTFREQMQAIAAVNPMAAPTSLITQSSRIPECHQELGKGLEQLATDLGLGYQVTGADGESLFANGEVAKSYARDSVKYTLHFRLRAIEDGCKLQYYKRETREPGHSNSTMADYGTVSLRVCQCAAVGTGSNP